MESRHDLYVGVEVFCIDDKVPLADGTIVKDKNITEGEVYRIRWIGITKDYVFGEYLGVKLEGIKSDIGGEWRNPDAPYNARRFRPLVSDPLAIFKRIATDPSWKVEGPEGPVRDEPLPPEKEPEREKEVAE
jgi:hypothetical protein